MTHEILLLSATKTEQEGIRDLIRNPVDRIVAAKPWCAGALNGRRVLLVQSGIGAVNTAHALTCVLQSAPVGMVLQFGVGGAYLSGGLDVGDLAVATEEAYGDLGVVTPEGWASAELIGIPLIEQDRPFFNRYPLDDSLVEYATEVIRTITWNGAKPRIKTGTFITVQQCSGVAAVGNEIAARFDGICENMEGAAAAQICKMYETPFMEVRCISNRVEDRDISRWDLPLSIRRARQAAIELVRALPLNR